MSSIAWSVSVTPALRAVSNTVLFRSHTAFCHGRACGTPPASYSYSCPTSCYTAIWREPDCPSQLRTFAGSLSRMCLHWSSSTRTSCLTCPWCRCKSCGWTRMSVPDCAWCGIGIKRGLRWIFSCCYPRFPCGCSTCHASCPGDSSSPCSYRGRISASFINPWCVCSPAPPPF